MDNKNTTITKGNIIKAAAATVLLSSCSKDYLEHNIGDGHYDDLMLKSSYEKGEQLLNITEFKLTDEVEKYAQTMRFLIEDITKSEDASFSFCKDPDAYLEQGKFSDLLGININEYLNKKDKIVLIAIADKEVREVAKKGDIAEFIRLCKSKGLLSDVTNIISREQVDYARFFQSEEEYNLFFEQISEFERMSNSKFTDKQDCGVLGLFVGIKIGVVADDYVLDRVEFWGYGAEMVVRNVIKEEPVLKLWTKENNDTYIPPELFFDELVIKRAEELSNAIVEIYPNYDKEKIQEFIAINLQKGYEFKKGIE